MSKARQEREQWDLFNRNGEFVSVFTKGNNVIPRGLYHKTVEIVPTDMQGNLLILRRSMMKKMGAGKWEFPSGSVLTKETEEDAALRELMEETGLKASKIFFLQTMRGDGMFRTTYLAYIPNLMSAKIHYDENEIMDHKIVSYRRWQDIVVSYEYNTNRLPYYNRKFFAMVEKLTNYYVDKEAKKAEQAGNQPVAQHKPLTSSSHLAKKHRASDQHIEPQPDIEYHPDIEPEEGGDDGA